VTGEENAGGRALTTERLAGVEVALEFTQPSAAPVNLIRLAGLGIPTVCGTTGWRESLMDVERAVHERRTALLHSPNFSIGVQVLLKGAGELARRFAGRAGFAGFIVEQHHPGKVDSPSGTALKLREVLGTADSGREYPITSIRAGSAPGYHSVSWDAPHETVRLEHTTRSREVFAAGALLAAEWLPGHRGVFTFEEMLFGREP
jgi:4-hydroxy-tetrahydrodipicolinate reductase